MGKIFNISSSNSFVDVLADSLLQTYENNELELAEVLVLLPNRRACRALADAFVRLKGMNPTLLPQMKAIGDVREDELILNGVGADEAFLQLPPAVDPLERMMLFIRLIMSRYADFGLEKISLAQACYLAQDLGTLIDKATMYNLDWDGLKNLAPEEYAAHWQDTLKFLAIITRYWPDILQERGVIDAGDRKNRLIAAQSFLWQQNKPLQKIIVAGSTAVSPVMKELVKMVLELPNGEVYLAGLDKYLDDESWEEVDETHPQFELRQLLDYLHLSRENIPDLVLPKNAEREQLISEVMRPATTSDKWRMLKGKLSASSVEGLHLLACDDQRLEALSIALLIRRVLETPEKTVALVTPDRNLARRVASELKRWDIQVDDSAGVPLGQTPWGIFMRLCVLATDPSANREAVLALLKNKLFADENPVWQTRSLSEKLDKVVWRQHIDDMEATEFLQDVARKTQQMQKLFVRQKVLLKDILPVHIAFAESLAATDTTEGRDILWQGEDGAAGAAFLSEWLEKAEVLGEIDMCEYLSLFEAMMAGIMVRHKNFAHSRVRILGAQEARLTHFDEVIVGGFNEGIWPAAAPSDPWMSRPMKREFGFEQPERQIGVLGLDLSNLLGAPQVWLTRSKMTDGTPTIQSRWGMRLDTVLQALSLKASTLQDKDCLHWAECLDIPDKFIKIEAPAPKPPVAARPRRLSASAFEKLIRDPYGVFAEYILRLKPLDELEMEVGPAEFGTLVHKVLEDFGRTYPTQYPDNALDILVEMGNQAMDESGFPPNKQAFWRPKLFNMLTWVVAREKEYRPFITQIHTEVQGNFFLENMPGGRFEIYAKADRVDEDKEGNIHIIDYKTGGIRTVKEITGGYAPQLPIEGLIAVKGGFEGIKASEVRDLTYWKLGVKEVSVSEEIEPLLADTEQHIATVVNSFDFESTGYLSRPNPKHVPDYSDYEHLARVQEWSIKEKESDE
jgi:ATP-dependent helicase/nuclease subunit B